MDVVIPEKRTLHGMPRAEQAEEIDHGEAVPPAEILEDLKRPLGRAKAGRRPCRVRPTGDSSAATCWACGYTTSANGIPPARASAWIPAM